MQSLAAYLNKIKIADGFKKEQMENLYVKKIVYYRENKVLNIHMDSKSIMDVDFISKLEGAIKIALCHFKDVKIKMKYTDLDVEDKNGLIKSYWKHIIKYIELSMPSIKNFVKDMSWRLENDNLTIEMPCDFLINMIKNKKLEYGIKSTIAQELGVLVEVDFISRGDTFSGDYKSYLKEKEIEAANMVKSRAIEAASSEERGKPSEQKEAKPSKPPKSEPFKPGSSYRKTVKYEPVKIADIGVESGKISIEGKVFDMDSRELRNGKVLYIFSITDYTSSICCKIFANEKKQEEVKEVLSKGAFLNVQGESMYDSYSREVVMNVFDIKKSKPVLRVDEAQQKRVELHAHTNMSAMDAVASAKDIVQRAASWGHSAVAITDHGIVQAYPDAMSAAEKCGIKVIYGMEGYLVNDNIPIIDRPNDLPLSQEFVVFDLETTGLSSANSAIMEIGAVKIRNFEIVDRFSCFVNPKMSIPLKIQELTGINNAMVDNEPEIKDIMPRFMEFIKDSVLVAHNAEFDMGFVRESCKRLGIKFENSSIDTIAVAKVLLPELKRYKLNVVAKALGVSLKNHHRAVDDAQATADIFINFLERFKNEGVEKLSDINFHFKQNDHTKLNTFHITILAKNYTGLKKLYKILSKAHIDYFYKRPRIPKSLLTQHREGLVIGSACEAGELYQAVIKNVNEEELEKIALYYDYFEVMPLGNNKFMIDKGIVSGYDELKDINKRIIELGRKLQIPVAATGDVHFVDPHDGVYRKILKCSQGFSDADEDIPLYFKTTDEMLEDFSYLGSEAANEVVIENPNKIADMIEDIRPVPKETFPPIIEGSDDELRRMCYEKANSIYGDPLPEIVQKRLDRELNSIISNGYAVMYIIAQRLVKKSVDDGYLVGSRGSVGSSFAATMSSITEVNPLPPHYICGSCKTSEFFTDGRIGSGADLPEKTCPKCGAEYTKEGHDIPFEVFLGFEGDKEPDIDLNFAGEYQATAHKYTEVLFGKGYVYKAGTIGTIADKTAYGFVKKYVEEKGIVCPSVEIERLSGGCTGIKRTSGQHPGGIMVVPDYKEIFDFCPIQYPANDSSSGVITTHFDYHSISGRLLKLDILGHDTPTIIKMLEEFTGIDATHIALDDEETMGIFSSTHEIGVEKEDVDSPVATFAVPEFGTKFVRQMLVDTKPNTFAELVRISGLSHGTDVWLNNAQELVRAGTAELKEVICTRDDIMNYLIQKGVQPKHSFKIMENVRKGKGLREEDEQEMEENNVPQWYIDSCNKIKYMFPKAHAVAYVMMSFRIAYFKVHYPRAFYATYFTIKAEDFDITLISRGRGAVLEKMKEIDALGNTATAKDKNIYTLIEVVNEMFSRGIEVMNVDLYNSDAKKFKIVEGRLLPPLVSFPGLGENAALNVVSEREKGEFLSIEDLRSRTKLSKTVLEMLNESGCLYDMPETNQLSLL